MHILLMVITKFKSKRKYECLAIIYSSRYSMHTPENILQNYTERKTLPSGSKFTNYKEIQNKTLKYRLVA